MENNNPNYVYNNVIQLDDEAASSRKFIANVFMWMFVALGISSLCAYEFAADQSLREMLINPVTGPTGLAYIAMFAPLAFVLLIRFGLNRIPYGGLAILFVIYAALTGISLSFILLMYTTSSVLGVFIGASAMFGVMAIAGYTTHTDLTKMGSLLIMGLIGIIIASVANMFIHSDGMSLIISYIGVIIFVGLTAYDVQKLKQIGAGLQYGEATAKKYALMGGLTLYLDFINLFLMLLRIFGKRR